MCYMVVVSTTSTFDLTQLNTPLVKFSKDVSNVPEAVFLKYPHKWFVGSKDGCSCAFRHLGSDAIELGFTEPADWLEEDQEDIEATRELAEKLSAILSENHQLDCVDAWANDSDEPVPLAGSIEVDLHAMSARCLRFFEGYHLDFKYMA